MNKLFNSLILLVIMFCCMGAGPYWVENNLQNERVSSPVVYYPSHYFAYYSHYYQPVTVQYNYWVPVQQRTRFQAHVILTPTAPVEIYPHYNFNYYGAWWGFRYGY